MSELGVGVLKHPSNPTAHHSYALAPKSETHRYVVMYEIGLTEEKIHGVFKLDNPERLLVEFLIFSYNKIGSRLTIFVREISQSEFETYQAFDLFPTLVPYERQIIERELVTPLRRILFKIRIDE